MRLDQPLRHCAAAIAMGSHDLRTASYAAHLVWQGWAPFLVCSGASGRLTEGVWIESEAQIFADEALRTGLPEDQVLLEDRSTNTGENLLFSLELLKEKGLPHAPLLLVHKPYMERRVLATAGKILPDVDIVVTSPPIAFEKYPLGTIPMNEVIAIMVGDFQRVIEYPQRGFALPQVVPDEALQAFQSLTAAGFTSHLL